MFWVTISYSLKRARFSQLRRIHAHWTNCHNIVHSEKQYHDF